MIDPAVLLRMKQRNYLLRQWIRRRHKIGLVTITGGTRKAEIVERRFTAFRTREDMLKLKNGDRQSLGGATVGTAARKALANPPLQIDGNVDAHVPVASAFS